MKLQVLAVLVSMGLCGACTAAGITWMACWLVGTSPLIAALSAQCAGLLGATISVGICTLFQVAGPSGGDMY